MSDDPTPLPGAQKKRDRQAAGSENPGLSNLNQNQENVPQDLEAFENAQDQDLADKEADLVKRFPALGIHNVPDAPKIKVDLPPHPNKPGPGMVQPGGYKGTALAMQAASSFIMPIIVLGILGWFLDGRFHTSVLLTILFFILGFVVGTANLMRVVSMMDDSSTKKK